MVKLTREQVKENVEARRAGKPIPHSSSEGRGETVDFKRKRALAEYSPSIGAFSPLGPRTPEAEALDRLAVNAALLGAPTKIIGSAAEKKIAEDRRLTGGYGAATEGISMLPISLLVPQGKTRLAKTVAGGLFGAASGYGLSGEGQEAAGTGIGTAIGVAPPLAGAALKGGYGAAKGLASRFFSTPEELAVKRSQKAISEVGLTPQILEEAIPEPSPITLAEQTAGEYGEGVLPLVRQAVAGMGKTREEALEQIGERTASSPKRVSDVAEKALPKGDADKVALGVKTKRAETSKELYDSAYKDFIPSNGVLSSIGKLFSGKNRLPTLGKIQEKAINNIRDDVELGLDIPYTKTVNVGGKQTEVPVTISDLSPEAFNRVLNEAKVILDDKISSQIQKSKWGEVRRLTNLKDSFVKILDDANPIYAKARAEFSGDTALINALDMGKNVFGTKMTAKDVGAFLNNATKSEKEHFRLGVSKFIQEQLESGKIKNVRGLLNKDYMNRLESAWPDKESFNLFSSTVKSEVKMAEQGAKLTSGTGRVAGEDGTILGAISEAATSTPVAGRAAAGSTQSAIAVAASKFIRNIFGEFGKIGPEEADELAKIWLASTPEQRAVSVGKLVQTNKITQRAAEDILDKFEREPISAFIEGVGGLAGRPSTVTLVTTGAGQGVTRTGAEE